MLGSISLLAALVVTGTDNVVLDFTASWCGPCQQMSPVVARLERQGLPIRTVDVDLHPDLVRKYRIQNIPAFVLIVDGKEADRSVGQTSETTLRQMARRAVEAEQARRNAEKEKQFESPRRLIPLFVRNSLPKARQETDQDSSEDTAPIVRAKYDTKATPDTQSNKDGHLLHCVRIRVHDKDGINFGSGTLIASRPGRSIILTCGHVFRAIGEGASIEVDVFNGEAAETFSAQVIHYDLEADVGLIAIPSVVELPISPIASARHAVSEGETLLSVGCSGGDLPTKETLRVTKLNRYLGPDNVECTGVPVQGRSGGGLFNSLGEVVGVCIAADPRDERGLYCGLKPIHEMLDKAGLSFLYHDPLPAMEERSFLADVSPTDSQQPDIQTTATPDPTPLHSASGAASGQAPDSLQHLPELQRQLALQDNPPIPESRGLQPAAESQPAVMPVSFSGASPGVSTPMAQSPNVIASTNFASSQLDAAQIQEMFDQAGDAEVVCVIRPLAKPRAASRVVIINRASAKFVADLIGEVQSQAVHTSLVVPWPEAGGDASSNARSATTSSVAPVSSTSGPRRYRRSSHTR